MKASITPLCLFMVAVASVTAFAFQQEPAQQGEVAPRTYHADGNQPAGEAAAAADRHLVWASQGGHATLSSRRACRASYFTRTLKQLAAMPSRTEMFPNPDIDARIPLACAVIH